MSVCIPGQHSSVRVLVPSLQVMWLKKDKELNIKSVETAYTEMLSYLKNKNYILIYKDFLSPLNLISTTEEKN